MRIILADHHLQPRRALMILLDEQPNFEVVGEAVDGDDLLRLASEMQADAVLVDQELPLVGINDLITKLHALQASLLVVVMSSKPEYCAQMLEAGADAYISKMDQPACLLEFLSMCARQIDEKQARGQDSSNYSE